MVKVLAGCWQQLGYVWVSVFDRPIQTMVDISLPNSLNNRSSVKGPDLDDSLGIPIG